MSDVVPPTPRDIAEYYDAGFEECLRDFVYANKRVRIASAFFLSWLEARRPKRVLDIGCGIGSSTHLVCERCPWLEAVGIDISPKRIEAAKRLFPHPRLQFQAGTLETISMAHPFDAVLMMDVYEHIPRARLNDFHGRLTKLLAPGGLVLLTTPSPLHQAHLATTNPKALQIVDETIGVEEIAALARAIGGTVTSFNYRSIWRTNDYVHSVIERAPAYERRPDQRSLGRRIVDKLSRGWQLGQTRRAERQRAEYVRRRLGSG